MSTIHFRVMIILQKGATGIRTKCVVAVFVHWCEFELKWPRFLLPQQQLQGTVQVTLRNSPSGGPIDDGEVRRKFQQFGDVKSVRPVNDRSECVCVF
jgi:hypothetical protein